VLKRLYSLSRVRVSNAARLYPNGVDWAIAPGVNVIAGGTGLGKTTLVNAMLFGVFGRLGRSNKRGLEKVDSDYFTGRMTPLQEDAAPPTVDVEATFGDKPVTVARDLNTGRLVSATIGDQSVTGTAYELGLADCLGLENYEDQVMQVIDHLLYVPETPYFLAWDSHAQNELLSILFGTSETFNDLNSQWRAVQSADSEFRNLRFQAVRVERQIKELANQNTPATADSIAQQRLDYESATKQAITARENVIARWQATRDELETLQRQVDDLEDEYARLANRLEQQDPRSDDDKLSFEVFADARTTAIADSLLRLVNSPKSTRCLCCSNVPGRSTAETTRAGDLLSKKLCPICGSKLQHNGGSTAHTAAAPEPLTADLEAAIARVATKLRDTLLTAEQARSRLHVADEEKRGAEDRLAASRETEWRFQMAHPIAADAASDQRTIALQELRKDQQKAESTLRRSLSRFTSTRDDFNATLKALRRDIAKSLTRYCALFLDESCEIELDEEGKHAERRGPQVDPLHAAFYPVVDGQPRYRPESLSEAQRTFVDLAFRMALLDVWHRKTSRHATLVVETPEGSVDSAYMVRVAQMLREFAREGHTLIVTTNLNNDLFLPELLRGTPKRQRAARLLNLLDVGVPRQVQRKHRNVFDQIIERAIQGTR
jgi:hypothetical protein